MARQKSEKRQRKSVSKMNLADAVGIVKTRSGDTFLSTRQVAAILNKAAATVRDWRSRGVGPRYVRAGGVQYRWDDVQNWIEGKLVGTVDQPNLKGGGVHEPKQ